MEEKALTAAKMQSPLSALLETQEQTKALIRTLSEKLSPVANPQPVETDRISGDRGYHIETALYVQREINEAIDYMINSVVL